MNSTTEELAAVVEQEAKKWTEVLRLMTHPGVDSLRARAFVLIIVRIVVVLIVIVETGETSRCQTTPELQIFFEKNIGLSKEQIAVIRSGRTVARALPSRTPREVFLFGVVYVHGESDSYLQHSRNFNSLRKLPNYLAIGVLSNPPKASEFDGFSLNSEDIEDLKKCKPGNCEIQLPASSIEDFQKAIHWTALDVNKQVNQLFQKSALERLLAYQREGNPALGVYNDKRNPTEVPKQFAYMLSYFKVFPEQLPELYHYLLTYPDTKPANVEDAFYWSKVKFGLKPTLRVVHVVTVHSNSAVGPTDVVAEKQLYSNHYFETALDLTFCIPGRNNPKQPGFYLIGSWAPSRRG